MRILNLILLSLLLTLLLSSCGPIFKTVEIKGESMSNYYSRNANNYSNKASIYFLRPGEKHMGQHSRIYVDGQKIIELPKSGCYKYDVSAGNHTLVLDLKGGVGEHELTKNFPANTEHFFEIKPRLSRTLGIGLFSVVGVAADYALSNSKNDGEIQFIDTSKQKATQLFNKCVFYKKENQ